MGEGDAELEDLYRDVLVDYYRDDSYKGVLAEADIRAQGVNPVCGDEVDLTMTLVAGVVDEVRFSGHGCVISQASSGMMCEALQGKSLDECRALAAAFKGFMLERSSPDALPGPLEEVKALAGVRKFPIRIKCALLGWNTLLEGISRHAAQDNGDGGPQ